MDTLIIRNRNSSEELKRFLFEYQFPKNSSASGNSQNDYRMFLEKVTEKSSTGLELPPYRFYYESFSDLPSRLSKSQDHWGYYNGKNNLKSCPITDSEKDIYLDISNGTVWDAFPSLRTVDRDADYTFTVKGILNMIQYPTGGYTKIDYEPNTSSSFSQAGGLRVKRVTTKESFSDNTIIERYSYSIGLGGNLPRYFSRKYGHSEADGADYCYF